MTFKMKYDIKASYLTAPSKRRSGIKADKIRFVVLHDTGNSGSTAAGNVGYYQNSRDEISASAHLFVDDKEIIECIPALTGTPEKAWHVIYNVTTDNERFGDDANDSAIGIEWCYGGKVNMQESYKRYIWVAAYTAYKFGLDPKVCFTGHFELDPARKTDPKNALGLMGKTFDQLKADIVAEYNACTQPEQKVVYPMRKEDAEFVLAIMSKYWSEFVGSKDPNAKAIQDETHRVADIVRDLAGIPKS